MNPTTPHSLTILFKFCLRVANERGKAYLAEDFGGWCVLKQLEKSKFISVWMEWQMFLVAWYGDPRGRQGDIGEAQVEIDADYVRPDHGSELRLMIQIDTASLGLADEESKIAAMHFAGCTVREIKHETGLAEWTIDKAIGEATRKARRHYADYWNGPVAPVHRYWVRSQTRVSTATS